MKSKNIVSKIHLVISILVVVPVSIIYGFNPNLQFNIFLGTTDEHNFFKAIMGLYLGFSLLWLLGLFNTKYLRAALISNVVFMFGLAFGRLLSLIIDGVPTSAYVYGTLGEFILGFYGIWVLYFRFPKKL